MSIGILQFPVKNSRESTVLLLLVEYLLFAIDLIQVAVLFLGDTYFFRAAGAASDFTGVFWGSFYGFSAITLKPYELVSRLLGRGFDLFGGGGGGFIRF